MENSDQLEGRKEKQLQTIDASTREQGNKSELKQRAEEGATKEKSGGRYKKSHAKHPSKKTLTPGFDHRSNKFKGYTVTGHSGFPAAATYDSDSDSEPTIKAELRKEASN